MSGAEARFAEYCGSICSYCARYSYCTHCVPYDIGICQNAVRLEPGNSRYPDAESGELCDFGRAGRVDDDGWTQDEVCVVFPSQRCNGSYWFLQSVLCVGIFVGVCVLFASVSCTLFCTSPSQPSSFTLNCVLLLCWWSRAPISWLVSWKCGCTDECLTLFREALRAELINSGLLGRDAYVVVAGPGNTYGHYITTKEEYSVQRYEGASTLYGQCGSV